jgi:DNA repair protein RecO (recombination protein O)
MSTRDARRVRLAPAYLLHHQPYRDTSRILEVLTREQGRLTLFARGVRGPKAKLAAVLQPFQPLLVSFSGRGEAAQLTGAELAAPSLAVPPACLMSCFYLSELVLKLTTRHDPHPALFDAYHEALAALKEASPERALVAATLRIFEKRLLEELGYGLDLEAESGSARDIDPRAFYHFRAEQGLVPASADAPGALPGSSLVSLARERLTSERELEDARCLLTAALAHCLEGRELATRAVARSIARRESRP